jgi:DNA-binding SARP family transcriptional activator
MTVVVDGREIPVNGVKLQAVLAYLLVHRGTSVTTSAIVDELWPRNPSPTADNTVQTYVRQLRNLLEPDRPPGRRATVLRTVEGGYQLDIDADQLDSAVFEREVRTARQALHDSQPDRAAAVLRSALALWTGPAMAQLDQCATIALEAQRLTELRLTALELRCEADLRLGRHDEVVDELTELSRDNPLRENVAAQLVLALYRCGRQGEALAAYQATRTRLADELGIEPNTTLRQLHERILRQDPTLAPPRRVEAAPPVPAMATRRSGSNRVTVAAAAFVVAATAIALTWHQDRNDDASTFNEYDLAVSPGMGYDLDIPAGRPPDWHATNNPRSADYDHLDLYRTSARAPVDQVSGVDPGNTGDYNAVHVVDPADSARACQTMSSRGGGNAAVSQLSVGSKICISTHDQRWALLTVRRLPVGRASVLLLHITVLA